MDSLHIPDEQAILFAGAALLLFVIMLCMSLFRNGIRLIEYRFRLHRRVPAINKLHFALYAGLAIPFVAFLGARAMEITGLRNYIPWIVVTTLPALIAMFAVVWFEYKVIETPYHEDETCPCACHR